MAKFPEISHFSTSWAQRDGTLCQNSCLLALLNAASRKNLEIQAYSITKLRTLLKRKFV